MRRTHALTLVVSSVVVLGTPAVTAATTTPPPTTAPATTAAAAPTTAPVTTAAAATTAAPPTAPAPGGATTTTVPTDGGTPASPAAAPTLAADATVADLQAAAEAIIGVTDDAFGRFAGIAPFPLAIPTPAGSFLSEFSVQYFDDDYVGTMNLQLAVPAADAIAQWQAAAAAAGMTLEEDTTASNGEISERTLQYDLENADGTDNFLVFTVTDAPDVDDAHIQFEGAISLEASEFTRSWTALVSLPTTGGEWSYGTYRYDTDFGGSVGSSWDFPGGDAAALKSQVIAAMPANGFSYDAAADTEPERLTLTGEPAGFTEASFSFRPLEGLASVSADASFEADTPPIPEPAAPDPSATTAAPATTAPAGPTTPVSTAAPLYTPGVPAGATTAQIRDLAKGIFGPTTDAPAELSPFIPVLSGIPTPPDAVVEAFDIYTLELSDGTVATGKILFTTATPPAESLALYASAAASLGMVEVANQTSTEEDGVTTAVAYEVPGDSPTPGFDVYVVDGETDYIQLTINTPTTEPVGTEINAAVIAAVGLPPGGEVDPELNLGLAWFSDDLNFTTRVTYPGDEATVKASVDAAVLAAGGTLDAEASSDSFQYYNTADGGEVQISVTDNGDGTSSVSAIYSLSLGL